jgi:heme A synthase
MSPTSAVPLAVYGVLIGITSAVLWVWTPYTLPPALLSGGALLFLVVAAIVALRGRAKQPELAEDRPVPDLSFATVGIALGIINVVVGLYLGLYLILIGAAILALGVGGMIREARAQRRSRETVDAT